MNLKLCFFILSMFFFFSCKEKQSSVAVIDLKCEYQKNPIGIDRQQPLLQWKLSGEKRGIKQTAYQVLVASSKELLAADNGDCWNSGVVQTAENVHVSYKGISLSSEKSYFWKVRIWDEEGNKTSWSPSAEWQTALMNSSEWTAQWIARDTKEPFRSAYFRKEFRVPEKKIHKATVLVTGLGSYIASVNGQRLGNDLLSPGWTDYEKRLEYQVYDATNILRPGDNVIGAITGNMWWSGGIGWQGGTRYSDGPLRMLAQLDITFEDGTTQQIITDKSWKWSDSPVVANHIYDGETYHAGLEQQDWNKAGFDDSTWKAVEMSEWGAKLYAQQAPPIRVEMELNPVSVTEVKKGIFVFDYGQNVVGWTRLKVNAKKGEKITMRFAELLHDDGTVAQENLRSAKATDVYIAKGEGTEEWQPHFTYHGFRYVQVEGLSQQPDKTLLTALVFHADEPLTGSFECSNKMINRIYQNTVWGQRGNFMAVPTDCPQRDERLGWMGDAQIFAPTANFNMNLERFWQKWMRDITDGQTAEGWVHDVSPAIVVEGPAKPGWGDAVAVIPWLSYKYFADLRIVAENYEAVKAWVEYMNKNSKDYIYIWSNEKGDWFGYGDWIAVVSSPAQPISASYFYYSTKLLSDMAGWLGKTDDAQKYHQLAENIAKAYQAKYWDPKKMNYEGETQAANLLPLAFGITPDSLKEKVIENIANDVIARGYHPSTGFLGTGYILTMLSKYGHHDLAYKIMAQDTYPSWGYMVKKGATTMWELWNSDTERPEGMNSRNHFALGGVCEWLFNYLGGIKADINNPGFKHLLIAPQIVDDLDWVKTAFETNYGKVVSNWTKTSDHFEMTVSIPANTTATVEIPVLNSNMPTLKEGDKIIIENGKLLADDENIELVMFSEQTIVLNINSGEYVFSY